MSSSICAPFTKEEDKKNGRNGYAWAKYEKETSISPYYYGAFLSKKKRRKKEK